MDVNKIIKRLVLLFVLLDFANRFFCSVESNEQHEKHRLCYAVFFFNVAMGILVMCLDGYNIVDRLIFPEEVESTEDSQEENSEREGGGEDLIENSACDSSESPNSVLQNSLTELYGLRLSRSNFFCL
ncbi:hypothetical protein EDL79_04060 [Ehrlichia ruminantium]|uniref:Uncharacterized protein n=1 Tax=Ehrlichia ruminantium TaxID=779 RepID=A0AAE6QBU8_EHRRU|nr:hypothetical protein [Ehrlichia ruminantium]QGR03711.1 hypothetical protein EDL80_04050 [Ehrlichia ruminantium]QGR04638.1 hypothetical protein EDL79_04060 [Ehrlichia ruminantium]